MDLGRTLLRTVVGGLFIGHGTQKLFGWFGGPGPEGTAGFFEALDLRPSRPKALAAGAAETGAGAMLVLGALTPLAAAAITGVMATAIEKVHGPKGLWNTQGGYEFNLVMATSALALTADGPGVTPLQVWEVADIHDYTGSAADQAYEKTMNTLLQTLSPHDRFCHA